MFILIEFYCFMNITTLKYKLKRVGYFMPFNVRFVLLVAALLWAATWLVKNNALSETSRTAIINLFISVISLFALSILIVSFLTAFIPWIFFLINKKNNRSSLKIKVDEKENLLNENRPVVITINNIIKPLFGYIRLRLFLVIVLFFFRYQSFFFLMAIN